MVGGLVQEEFLRFLRQGSRDVGTLTFATGHVLPAVQALVVDASMCHGTFDSVFIRLCPARQKAAVRKSPQFHHIDDTQIGRGVARKYNLVTNLGKLIDPLADKLLVISALVVLAKYNQISLWIVLVIIFRELLITGLRAIVAAEGVVIAAETLGKWKTATQMVALTVIILIPLSYTINNILLLIPLILTIVSGIEYVWKSRNVLTDK